MIYHNPVLLQATVKLLDVEPGGKYIDATLGGGGHTQEILNNGGYVLGLDQDQDAIDFCSKKFSQSIIENKLRIIKSNFINIKQITNDTDWKPIKGIIFDLGISSHQIDTPMRGFSFQNNGPLDMRMDKQITVSAREIINNWPEKAISQILKNFGELQNANQLAKKIISARPLDTTHQLSQVVQSDQRQVFQALRIAINDELSSLSMALDQSIMLVASGGKICVITFHSLEDRIVKTVFQAWEDQKIGVVLTRSPITPDDWEQSENSRSKSAKLRVFKKL